MESLLLIGLIAVAISFLASYAVYNKLSKLGKNPWPLSIITFILAAVLVLGGIFAFLLAAFER